MKHTLMKTLVSVAFLSLTALPALAVDYMQMFNSLPDAEKQKLIQQYGGQAAQYLQNGPAVDVPSAAVQAPQDPVKRDVNQGLANSKLAQEAAKGLDQADLSEKQVTTEIKETLKPFGYDLFAGEPSSFVQLSNVPVPTDYIMGPGDSLNVALFGNENANYSLVIDREGYIQLPKVGPVSVAGLSFSQARQMILSAIKRSMIGVDARVTTGALRSIRVFMLGEVFKPGSYVVSGLSTLSQGLISSGGVKDIGSLRQIELRRKGKTIAKLDLYDFLLKGDMSQDKVLQDGDVIFVPTLEETVAIGGEVLRPAIYELKNEKNFADLLALAGGFTTKASPSHVKLQRLRKDGYREIMDLNLNLAGGLKQSLRHGDSLRVLPVVDEFKNVVLLKGNLTRPGDYQWREGLKIADLFTGSLRDEFLPQTDLEHVLILREKGDERKPQVLMANLLNALQSPQSKENVVLASRDQLIFLSNLPENRAPLLEPVLAALRNEASIREDAKLVTIAGFVRFPGTYPLTPQMTIDDLLGLAGGMTQAAYGLSADLVRISRAPDGERQTVRHETKDLKQADVLAMPLQANDTLSIKQLPAYAERKSVRLSGEVKFPGEYIIIEGETLADLIARAGGVSHVANPRAIVLKRERVKAQQAQELENLRLRLKQLMLQNAANRNAGTPAAFADLERVMAMADQAQATGRLSLNLTDDDVQEVFAEVKLESGDEVFVPQVSSVVNVIGEVYASQSLLYRESYSGMDYIQQAGGVNLMGDLDNAYVVKASGAVLPLASNSIFYADAVQVEAGDTLVVPMDLDRLKPLEFWKEIASVAGQIGLALASFKTVGVF